MTLEKFLESGDKNAHVTFRNLETLFVRKSVRFLPYMDGGMYQCFDIASVTAKTPHTGAFKGLLRFLLLNQTKPIYVESVLDPKFGEALERLLFTRIGTDEPGNYVFLRSYEKMEQNVWRRED